MPTLQEQLDEARSALHQLRIGAAAVSVGYGDARTEYTPASLTDLKVYVAQLEAKIAGARRARNRVRYGVPD